MPIVEGGSDRERGDSAGLRSCLSDGPGLCPGLLGILSSPVRSWDLPPLSVLLLEAVAAGRPPACQVPEQHLCPCLNELPSVASFGTRRRFWRSRVGREQATDGAAMRSAFYN